MLYLSGRGDDFQNGELFDCTIASFGMCSMRRSVVRCFACFILFRTSVKTNTMKSHIYLCLHLHYAWYLYIDIILDSIQYTYLSCPQREFTVHSAYSIIDRFLSLRGWSSWTVTLIGTWRRNVADWWPLRRAWRTFTGWCVRYQPSTRSTGSYANHILAIPLHEVPPDGGPRYILALWFGVALSYSLGKSKCVFLFVLSWCHIMMNVQYTCLLGNIYIYSIENI